MAALQVSFICRLVRVAAVAVFLMVVMFGPTETSSQMAYGEPCDPRADSFGQRCADLNTSCVMSRSGHYLCLCAAAFYRHPDSTCHEVSELQVFDISVSVSHTKAVLAWDTKDFGVNVTYTVQQYPGDGQVEKVSESGAVVSGLIPQRSYSFVVTATLQSGMCYRKKSVQAYSDIVAIVPGGGPKRQIVHVKELRGSSTPRSHEVAVQTARDDVFRNMKLELNGTSSTNYVTSQNFEMFWFSSLQPDTEYNYTLTIFYTERSKLVGVQTGTLRTPPSGKDYGELCSTSEECISSTVCGDETGTCICDERFYHNPYRIPPRCDFRHDIGVGCKPYIPNQCHKNCACVTTPENVFTCQCDRSHYQVGGGQCLPLSRLQVWNITTDVTHDTVTFKWSINRKESDRTLVLVTYWLEWTPGDNTVPATSFGGQVSGLKPETDYKFTILAAVRDYRTKRTMVPAGTVRTLSMPKSAGMIEMETKSDAALGVSVAVACLTLVALIVLVVLLCRRKSSQFSMRGLSEAQSSGYENPSAPQGKGINGYKTTAVQQEC